MLLRSLKHDWTSLLGMLLKTYYQSRLPDIFSRAWYVWTGNHQMAVLVWWYAGTLMRRNLVLSDLSWMKFDTMIVFFFCWGGIPSAWQCCRPVSILRSVGFSGRQTECHAYKSEKKFHSYRWCHLMDYAVYRTNIVGHKFDPWGIPFLDMGNGWKCLYRDTEYPVSIT